MENEKGLQLSRRLSAIAAMVSSGNVLADVGCDHGYLPIDLVQRGRIPRALAMDVREGPLARAKAHVEASGLSDRIETRLSDGLVNYRTGEADTLVIAGMGGLLTIRILDREPDKTASFSEIILEPQSDANQVRRYLRSHGFEILKEDMVLEDGKFYPVMYAQPWEEQKLPSWSDEDYYYGKHLLEAGHPVLLSYLNREMRVKKSILSQLETAGSEAAKERRQEIEQEIRNLERAIAGFREE